MSLAACEEQGWGMIAGHNAPVTTTGRSYS